MTTPPERATGRYVYCVVPCHEPRSFGRIGIGGRGDEVYTVHWQDLAAVVSDSPPVPYDPDRENLLAHERVNETVLGETTVLPLAFGSVFRSEEDVVELLRRAYPALQETLARMAGKVEFDLKVHWDPAAALAQVTRETPDLARLAEHPPAASALSQIEVGRLVESRLKSRAETYARAIRDRLATVAAAVQPSETFGDTMIMNAAFLIERRDEERFAREVERLGEALDALSFRYSGPWPPYNFVRVRIQPGAGTDPAQSTPAE